MLVFKQLFTFLKHAVPLILLFKQRSKKVVLTGSCVLPAVVWRVFDENQILLHEFAALSAEPVDGGVAAADLPPDPVAEGVVGSVQKTVVKIDPKNEKKFMFRFFSFLFVQLRPYFYF